MNVEMYEPPEPLREREEQPPETFMEVYWHFRLNKRDSLLVLKALGGRLKDAEIKHAKELGDRLTVLRERAGSDNAHGLRVALENMTKAKEEGK